MKFMIFVLLICFFIFLYVLYYLSRDDFVIVRKDIQMERIFNMAFLTSFVALFFSRLFFIIFNSDVKLLNPLNFLALPYLPGLSLIGGILGGAVFAYLYSKLKNLPPGKIVDLLSMSFVSVMPLGFFLTFLLVIGRTTFFFNLLFIFSILIFVLFAKVIYPFCSKGEIKDGSLGLIFISLFSFLYFLTKLFLNLKTFSFLDPENILLLIMLFFPLILLINQEIIDKFLSQK